MLDVGLIRGAASPLSLIMAQRPNMGIITTNVGDASLEGEFFAFCEAFRVTDAE